MIDPKKLCRQAWDMQTRNEQEDDLVWRLRYYGQHNGHSSDVGLAQALTCQQAADRIEELEASREWQLEWQAEATAELVKKAERIEELEAVLKMAGYDLEITDGALKAYRERNDG